MAATTVQQEWTDADLMSWGVWDFVALLTTPARIVPADLAPEPPAPPQARATPQPTTVL